MCAYMHAFMNMIIACVQQLDGQMSSISPRVGKRVMANSRADDAVHLGHVFSLFLLFV